MKHALFCFCLTASVSLTAGGEFKNLLAVDSLEGWESIGKAKWTVNKGILMGSQDGDAKRWGYLQTKRKYKNFELRLDFKIDEHGKYNSGVYLRIPRDRKTGRAYQVNIGRGAAGEPVGLYLNDWLAKGDEHDKIRIPLKWNELRILIVDNRIQVWLNKKQIVDYTDENPENPSLNRASLPF